MSELQKVKVGDNSFVKFQESEAEGWILIAGAFHERLELSGPLNYSFVKVHYYDRFVHEYATAIWERVWIWDPERRKKRAWRLESRELPTEDMLA